MKIKNAVRKQHFCRGIFELHLTKRKFISFDLFNQHRRIYTFKNDCQEDKELSLGDGTYKIFLNCNGYGDEIDEDLADFLELLKGRKSKRKFAKDVEMEFKKLCNSKELDGIHDLRRKNV